MVVLPRGVRRLDAAGEPRRGSSGRDERRLEPAGCRRWDTAAEAAQDSGTEAGGPTVVMSGTIVSTGAQGVYLSGAQICVGQTMNCATTDSGGAFSLHIPANAQVAITIQRPGFTNVLVPIVTTDQDLTGWEIGSQNAAQTTALRCDRSDVSGSGHGVPGGVRRERERTGRPHGRDVSSFRRLPPGGPRTSTGQGMPMPAPLRRRQAERALPRSPLRSRGSRSRSCPIRWGALPTSVAGRPRASTPCSSLCSRDSRRTSARCARRERPTCLLGGATLQGCASSAWTCKRDS
jgi:hypothetical protein